MRALVLACVLAVPGIARAQAVTFDEALALAEETPQVRAVEEALDARASGDSAISDITHASRLYFMPGIRALSDADRGFEGQMQIGHSWSLAGLADARRRAAHDERDAIAAEVRALALTERLGAAHAWLLLRAVERRLALTRGELETATELEARIVHAAERGAATEADAAEARAFRADVALRVLAMEGESFVGSVALAAAMGREATHDLATTGPLPQPELPEEEALEHELGDVDTQPEVVRRRVLLAAVHAREVEVAAAAGPLMHTDLFAYRESPNGLMIFAQLGFDIPLADLAARDRSRLHEEEARLEGEEEIAMLQARRDAVQIAHEVAHARREEAALRDALVPALDALVASREAMLAVGEGTVMALLDARRRALEAHGRLAEAEAFRTWAEVRAWVLLAAMARAGGEP